MVPKPRPVQQRVIRCILSIGRIGGVGQAELYDAAVDAGAQAIGPCEAADPGYTTKHLALECTTALWVSVSLEEKDGLAASTVVD